jgi:Ca-activated chloride channel family protein
MLVIDISGSMDKGNKIGAAKDAAKAYVNGMQGGDQVGIVTFDSDVYEVQPITSDKDALTNAIDSLQTGSDTAMYDGILKASVYWKMCRPKGCGSYPMAWIAEQQ